MVMFMLMMSHVSSQDGYLNGKCCHRQQAGDEEIERYEQNSNKIYANLNIKVYWAEFYLLFHPFRSSLLVRALDAIHSVGTNVHCT